MNTSACMYTIGVLLGLVLCVAANSWVPNSASEETFAQGAAPMWHLASGTCFPSDAEVNGHQTDGLDPDNCNIGKLDHNCPSHDAYSGSNTHAPEVATYWMTRRCPDNTIRVLYDVYFKKDTGHKSDWEWAVVIYRPADGNHWQRSQIVMEQDGKKVYKNWGDIQNTFDWYDDWANDGQKNKNHPKLYFGKWHHSVHDDKYTTAFKDTCPPNSASDYRTNDFQWWSYRNLGAASRVPVNWAWGKADSFPMSFANNGGHDICTKI